MRTSCLILMFFCYSGFAYAQKPLIDSNIFDKWPNAGFRLLSSNGKYAVFSLSYPNRGVEYSIRSTDGRWEKRYWDLKSVDILKDGRSAVFETSGDSLYIAQLGTNNVRYIARASFYQVLRNAGREWLIWMQNEERYNRLYIQDTNTEDMTVEDSLISYWVCKDQSAIVIKKSGGSEASFLYDWVTLSNDRHHLIWKGSDIHGMAFGLKDGTDELVFMISDKSGGIEDRTLWYYKPGLPSSEQLDINDDSLIRLQYRLASATLQFSDDGRKLFFSIAKTNDILPSAGETNVDVWSYRDALLEEQQLSAAGNEVTFICSIDVDSRLVVQIEREGTRLPFGLFSLMGCNHYAVVYLGDLSEYWWREGSSPAMYVVSLDTGRRRLIYKRKVFDEEHHRWDITGGGLLSYEEKYIIYGDPLTNRYMSYNTASGDVEDTGMTINETYTAGWLPGDRFMLFFDKWDTWRVDLAGELKPINLTNGYGKKHHIQLRPSAEPRSIHRLGAKAKVLLKAFDTVTKYNGYYQISLDRTADPDSLTMGPYRYSFIAKASESRECVVQRESAQEAPNYFLTTDMRTFKAMTFVASQKSYNWFQADLVVWTLPDGSSCQGMLFKPENMDPARKYPLLINYYLRQSDELYRFREPAVTTDNINVPYFVGRGYVVFIPDIPNRDGAMGQSALETVISGIHRLSKESWMDTTKIGIQGQSFGGYLTNYLLTHSQLFAAAAEMAGVSDMVSAYGSIVERGSSNQDIFEIGQYRMIVSPWQWQTAYLANSAVLRADKVTTPLLMTHDKKDPLVPWSQGVEFFTALRRNGKRVWMLQYDQSGHSLQGDDAKDYTIRLEQFFDHYLKGTPPPRWMTEGIPARLKGVENRYELDRSGRIP